jgi:hypothetical protein
MSPETHAEAAKAFTAACTAQASHSGWVAGWAFKVAEPLVANTINLIQVLSF